MSTPAAKAEVGVCHLFASQRRGRPCEGDSALEHADDLVRERHRPAQVLLDEQDRRPLRDHRLERPVDALHDGRCEPDEIVELFVLEEAEILGKDTHDLVRGSVQHDLAAEDMSIGAELAAPESRGQDHDVVSARFLFGGQEITPKRGLDPECRKEVG